MEFLPAALENIFEIYEMLASRYGTWGLLLMAAILVLLVVQLCYYLGRYSRIPKFSNKPKGSKRKIDGISVVVVMGEDRWYLETVLPKLMKQKYRDFEVVLVTVGAGEDFIGEIAALKGAHSNLVSTNIEEDPRFPISTKMAYNVGIKAAKYENVVITTAEAVPLSGKWLECMARGFRTGEVLIAYCGVEPQKARGNKVMRSSRLMLSVRYLSSAIKGRPYRGMIHNMGFTKSIYFGNRGFDHLNMNVGEDDLFIGRIATPENTSVVLNPHATLRQVPWGDLSWWRGRRRFYAAAWKYYPAFAKSAREWEMGSRLLFFITTISAACIMPLEIQLAAAGAFLLRLVLVRFSMWRIRRRLNEPRLGWALMLYDLYSPVSDIADYFYRLLRPAPGVWR
jgi:hypothetical protein